MTWPTLIFACATALSLGIVAAVLLRVGGLVLVVVTLATLFVLRWLTGYGYPDLLESVLLLVMVQIGYLLGALTPLADRIARHNPTPPLTPNPSDDAD